MKCSKCGSRMMARAEDHRFEESGLAGVVLKNIKIHRCGKCEEWEAEIPRLGPLHELIAAQLVLKPARLVGPEVAFLRKFAQMEQEQYAKMADMHTTTLERWEGGRMKVAWAHELNLRLTAMASLGARVDADTKPLAPFTVLGLVNRTSKPEPLALKYHYRSGRWEYLSGPLQLTPRGPSHGYDEGPQELL